MNAENKSDGVVCFAALDGGKKAEPSVSPARISLSIRDYEGCLPSSQIRIAFEKSVRETTTLRKHFPLTMEGGYYNDARTNDAWVGFATGLRCAERIEKVYESLVDGLEAIPQ